MKIYTAGYDLSFILSALLDNNLLIIYNNKSGLYPIYMKRGHYMNFIEAVSTVITENWVNRKRLLRLALYDLKNRNGGTALGFMWNFINPALQILIYWFVFVVGLRKGSSIGGVPYIIWLIVGMVPWFFMSGCTVESDMSILGFSGVLKRMSFPMAVVPIKTVVTNLITHFISMGIVFAIVIGSKIHIGAQLWQLAYYMFACIFFLVGYALFGSSITVLFRDYHNIFNNIMRMMFFLSPAMWNPDTSTPIIHYMMLINPFAYIITGYRNAILYSEPLMASFENGIIFWIISITLFIAGCLLHMKLRHKFIDLL